jgi:hypothetical protein
MRQLFAFLEAIRVRNTTQNFHESSFMAKVNGLEMLTSLDELLNIGSKESDDSGFSKEESDAMEERALQLLKERRATIKNV